MLIYMACELNYDSKFILIIQALWCLRSSAVEVQAHLVLLRVCTDEAQIGRNSCLQLHL